MGLYVNPPTGDKIKWLHERGREVNPDHVIDLPHYDQKTDEVLVCLVMNPSFSAAAICDRNQEKMIYSVDDGRIKFWFYVPYHDLKPYLQNYKIEGRPDKEK